MGEEALSQIQNFTVQQPAKRGRFWVNFFSVIALLCGAFSLFGVFMMFFRNDLDGRDFYFCVGHAFVILFTAAWTMGCTRRKQRLFSAVGMTMILQLYSVLQTLKGIGLDRLFSGRVLLSAALRLIPSCAALLILYLMYRVCLVQTNVPVPADAGQKRNPALTKICLIPILLQLLTMFFAVKNLIVLNNSDMAVEAVFRYFFLNMTPISFFVLAAVCIAVCNTQTAELTAEEASFEKRQQKEFPIVYIVLLIFPVLLNQSFMTVIFAAALVLVLLTTLFSFLVSKIGIGGVKGAAVGGILFGWVGAIIGAILGKDK